jgi:acyl carrier protein
MTREEVYAKLRDILVTDFSVSPERIAEESTFRGHMGLDSLDTVDLIYLLKKTFALEGARSHDFRDLHTMRQVVDFLVARCSEPR